MEFFEQIILFLKKVSEWGVLQHISKIYDMLVHPRRFWQTYDRMSLNDKLMQFATYAALFASFLWLMSYSRPTSGELLKVLIIEISTIIPYILIAYLANSIVKKDWSRFMFFCVSCCYIKFICLIPELVFLRTYYETETPLMMAIVAFIPIIVELLNFVLPAIVYQTSKRKIIIAVLLSIAFLNIYDGVFVFTGWPRPRVGSSENLITKERYKLGQSVKNAYDIPTHVCSHNNGKDVFYLYSSPIDSVSSVKYENPDEYIKILKEDIDSLKAIEGRCLFKTNKEFFSKMYDLKKDVLYVHETKSYKRYPVIKESVIKYDSIVVDIITYQEFNRVISNENDRLLEQEIIWTEQYREAFSTNYIGYLWHPILFFTSVYKKDDSL